jgi:hypothetical protein
MTDLPTVTVRQFLSWGPCWPKDKLDALLDQYEDEPWNALHVLDYRLLPKRLVSDEDRLWVVLRRELIPDPVWSEFGYWCADQARLSAADAMESAGLPNQAHLLRELEPVTDRDTADAAGDAARAASWAAKDAAGDAAGDASWAAKDAAGDAAGGVARAAASWAAKAASWAAAGAASWAAAGDARDAAGHAQIRHLRKLLKAYEARP